MSVPDDQCHLLYEGSGMMEGIRSYLLSVTAAALIYSIITAMIEDKTGSSKAIKMICGVFMAVVILKPSIQLNLRDWKDYENEIRQIIGEPVAAGERMGEEAILHGLSRETEQRIRREAENLGCSLDVEVLWDGFQPTQITLEGPISPYGKRVMANWIKHNIGISEDAQIWIG